MADPPVWLIDVQPVPGLRARTSPTRSGHRTARPWTEGGLDRLLAGSGVDTLIISGGETDVCVLAMALGAIDRGFRVVIAEDALCGSSDETHDALMRLYYRRFTEQVETATVEEIAASWL